ncbi:hypothetical protein [Roseofilum capinflatum]|uniref:Uncharacterized protein n=1 Tax=Roseofilum capinflatum BLCC-M114 TaxID=3022440 RepID=A0ABT7B7M9_9CYAN|nr:hypothetical protein [Roseofilum capinflatum]MDJ1175184.1 hypothetical protein [Roseofilum capinflatum BLCC-M114]
MKAKLARFGSRGHEKRSLRETRKAKRECFPAVAMTTQIYESTMYLIAALRALKGQVERILKDFEEEN